jgi:hypothetical protein
MDQQYLTPREAADLIPGMTVTLLAQLRYQKRGPRYLRPTSRKVVYRAKDISEWLDASVQETVQAAS